jgi:hypothetical protein
VSRLGFLWVVPLVSALAGSPAVSLEGAWRARFELDSAWRLPGTPSARVASGRLWFEDASDAPAGAAPVYPGRFSVDFSVLGFQPGGQEAIGWYLPGDSLRIILDPSVDHGHLELVGAQAVNRIVGRWTLIGDPSGARGRFTLTRGGS